MKILVLSHTRCGSTTLCKWLSKELNIELDETPYDGKTFDLVFQKTNIIRKIVIEEYIPSNEVISKFNKVICLSRDNNIDTAISFIIANSSNLWHVEYDVTNDWIVENKKDIIEKANLYDYMKYTLKRVAGLQLVYENIYSNKIDLHKILVYLDIKSPQHLYMLNREKKYRKDTHTLIYDFKRKNII